MIFGSILNLQEEAYEFVKKNKKYYEQEVLAPLARDIGMQILKSKYCRIDVREREEWELKELDTTKVSYRAVVEVKEILKK